MTQADPPMPKRLRLGWIGWSVLVVVTLATVPGSLYLWGRSAGDVPRLVERARAAGFATTWQEASAGAVVPETIAALRRLHTLRQAVRSYAEDSTSYWDADEILSDGMPAGLPLYHASLATDPAMVAWLDTLHQIAGMPRTALPPEMHDTATDDIDISTSLDLLCELIPASPAERRSRSIVDAFQLATIIRPAHGLAWYSTTSTCSQLLRLVCAYPPTPGDDTALVAQVCRTLADRCEADFTPATAGTVTMLVDAWTKGYRNREHLQLERRMLTQVPALLLHPLSGPIVTRLGRGHILDLALERAIDARLHPGLGTAARLAEQQRKNLYMHSVADPSWWYARMEAVDLNAVTFHARNPTTLYLRLVASWLTNDPWPIDPWDPAGNRLRPILRDSIVIGAYSVGFNAIDDGGSRRSDACMSLGQPLGHPMAANPIKK